MLKTYIKPNKTELDKILQRPEMPENDFRTLIETIFEDVKTNGDTGIQKYSKLFDGIGSKNLLLTEEELNLSEQQISEELKTAIAQAKQNIELFHSSQKHTKVKVQTTEGVYCWQEKRPIEKIGLYVPGGTAPLFSTVLMLAVPAMIAGCKDIVLCTPPDKNGGIHPAISYVAQLCGIDKVVKVGGIQAIAAMVFGTESIPKVYKIFGPGNRFVTAAKEEALKYGVAIDLPAGPSELLVIADTTANPEFVAADLLSQAEHGADSQVLLISTSAGFIKEVNKALKMQIALLPRKGIALQALQQSKAILVANKDEAIEISDTYAPEHLIINTEDNNYYANSIQNAGSVFIGNYTPESAGDYASGTNHTLPTYGYAKQYSGVSLDSFLKTISFQEIDEKGLKNIGKTIEIMAENEGLQAHKNAVTIRLNSLKQAKK